MVIVVTFIGLVFILTIVFEIWALISSDKESKEMRDYFIHANQQHQIMIDALNKIEQKIAEKKESQNEQNIESH